MTMWCATTTRWRRGAASQTRPIDLPPRGEGGRPLRIVAVVTDARTGVPVQAVQLRCAD